MAGPNALVRGVPRGITTFIDANDAYTAGEVIQLVEVTSNPSKGTATVNGIGVDFAAPADFVGDTSFQWRMKVGGVFSSSVTVSVRCGQLPKRIGIRNYPRRFLPYVAIGAPVVAAVDDTATTTARTPVTISVLDNDTGRHLSVVDVTDPINGGLVAINSGTTITYTPDRDFTGVDTFTYTVSDGFTPSVGSVTVTVTPALLSAQDDFASTIGRNTVTVRVLDNDAGSGLSVSAVTQPAHGVSARADGNTTVTYQAAVGFAGIDTFTYTITDSGARTDVGNVQVQVMTPPLVVLGESASTTTTTPVVISVLANDSGTGMSVTGVTQGAHGTVTITGGGTTVTYTAANGFTGTDTFTYTVTDAYGQTGTGNVSVRVNAVAAVNANNDTVVAVSGVQQTISVLANDTGSNLSITSVTAPSRGGTATRINSNTQIQYTPLATVTGTETFSYTITDGSTSDTATVTATVAYPAFTPNDDAVTTAKNTPVTFSPLTNDVGTSLSITAINGGAAASAVVLNDDTAAGGPDYFLVPFSKLANENRPIGRGVQYGIPAGSGHTTTAAVSAVSLTDINDVGRGRLANLQGVQVNNGKLLLKVMVKKDTSNPGLKVYNTTTSSFVQYNGNPLIVYFPTWLQTLWPAPKQGEQVALMYDPAIDRAFQLHYTSYNATRDGGNGAWDVDNIHIYPLSGSDTPADDTFDGSSTASNIRFPAGCLRWEEVKDANPQPIRHALQFVGTYGFSGLNNYVDGTGNYDANHPPYDGRTHPNATKAHVNGKNTCWPADGTDGTWARNAGNLPYGTRIHIRLADAILAESTTASTKTDSYGRSGIALNLTARQKVIWYALVYYGGYLGDGNGNIYPNYPVAEPADSNYKGYLQVRITQSDTGNHQWPTGAGSAYDEVTDVLNKAFPYFWPIKNTRTYTNDSDLVAGMPWVGGTGPLDTSTVPTNSLNRADLRDGGRGY